MLIVDDDGDDGWVIELVGGGGCGYKDGVDGGGGDKDGGGDMEESPASLHLV